MIEFKVTKSLTSKPIEKLEKLYKRAIKENQILPQAVCISSIDIENDFVEVARDIQDKAKLCNCKIILPADVMCSSDLNNKKNIRMCKVEDIFDDHMILYL